MKTKSITGEELGQKLLDAVREMKAGLGKMVYSPVSDARKKSSLSFAIDLASKTEKQLQSHCPNVSEASVLLKLL